MFRMRFHLRTWRGQCRDGRALIWWASVDKSVDPSYPPFSQHQGTDTSVSVIARVSSSKSA